MEADNVCQGHGQVFGLLFRWILAASGYLLAGTTAITQPRTAIGIRRLDKAVQRTDYHTAISPNCGFVFQNYLARRHTNWTLFLSGATGSGACLLLLKLVIKRFSATTL